MTLHGKRATDRRVQKTQELLRHALFSLIGEKSYDSIVVKDILDRANVGRSTFYTHFSDKDELLVSGMHDMLLSVRKAGPPSSASPYEQIIWFSLTLFEHIDQHRQTSNGKMGTRGRAVVHEHLQEVLGELIAEAISKSFPRRREAGTAVPPDLVACYVASTYVLVLNWWTENKNPLPPKKVNDLFRSLVLSTLPAILK